MKRNIFFIVLWTSILLTCCTFPHYYYSPNVQNVPLFSEKNEFSANIAGSLGIVNPSFEIQAGYAFPAHIALTANYMTGGNDNSSNSIRDFSKNNYFEGTAGYYKSFKEIGVFEVYGGYGSGKQQHSFSYREYSGWWSLNWIQDGTADLSFSKIFIQPDIGIKIDWVEGAFSCRLSQLSFDNIDIWNTVYHLDELNTLKQLSSAWLLEPAITFRGGPKWIKMQIQLVCVGNLSAPDFLFEKFRFNIGLHLNLSDSHLEK